ncbi:MAG TPA: alpha/beta fold hydrolase [Candidatus Polarisedimenticolaceae bacterium]|nr:alpha/beta fold hydrolase [Candidatus Polarisedimenticolaceae bacterium]
MRFFRTPPGTALLVAAIGAVAALGMTAAQVHRVTRPERQPELPVNLGAALAKVEDVTFKSADGTDLDAWLFRGKPGGPPVVLCHDLGESKNALMNLAIAVNKAGFTVVAFDFRAHGGSGGSHATLGVEEARDVLGAVDYLGDLPAGTVDTRKIGIFGAGMGANAAVLAAADRPALRVLVLDGLWPDARATLVRHVFPDWPWGAKHLGALPAALFPIVAGAALDERRAADILPELAGRDLLLVAPAGDGRLDESMRAMYATLPERRDAERNLITLPATRASGLGADDLARYHEKVVAFFRSRLALP